MAVAKINPHLLKSFVMSAPGSKRVTQQKAQEVAEKADARLQAQRQGPSADPRSSVSPPTYSDSWRFETTQGVGTRLVNTADHSRWVESGVHPRGGPTQTMAYRPVREAIDGMTQDFF